MGKKTILFDFDGTIADTVGPGVAIFNTMARKRGFLQITKENEESLRDQGPREVMKALEIPTFRAPFVVRGLRKGIRELVPTLKVAEGMASALLELKHRGHSLGIVTSNSQENVEEFLRCNNIDVFDHIQAGSGLFRKTYAIRMTILRNRLKKPEIIFVGDEIRDIEAARNASVTVVAVTWGINSKQGLLKAQPDFIVDTAKELTDLLAMPSLG
jgi:phosphoglycolate phosphatase